jgi:hypothetical protein
MVPGGGIIVVRMMIIVEVINDEGQVVATRKFEDRVGHQFWQEAWAQAAVFRKDWPGHVIRLRRRKRDTAVKV